VLAAQIARAEALFANQENHDRAAQPDTPGRMAGREYAVSDQTAAAIWSRRGCRVTGRQAPLAANVFSMARPVHEEGADEVIE
jgi:hypothetical protein